MKLCNYNVVALTQQEELSVNGGGPMGRLIGWILGVVEVFVGDIAQGGGSGEWMLEVPPHILFS